MAVPAARAAPGPAPERLGPPEPPWPETFALRAPQREPGREPAPSMWRYLPIAFAATCVVVVVPALLAALIVPRDGAFAQIGAAALAVAGSLALASAGAALWKRQPRSRDVVFGELMLWGWARRWRTERRIANALELLEAGRLAGPDVDVERLVALSRLIESRDVYLHGHSRRVARHAARIARTMGLSPEEVARIRTAAEVHDVGKLHTPRAVLNNPDRGSLTYGELALIRLHAADGARMAGTIAGPQIAAIVRHHHERIDGGGYPDGLAGSAIPLGARIIAVADTFDAITSDRAYRPAGSQKDAFDVLSAEAGAQLDASVVLAFRRSYSARRSVGWTAFGAAAAQRIAEALGSAASNVGIGSAGSLLPALGAAGVLAISPGLFRDSRAPRSASGPATAAPTSPAGARSPAVAGQAPGGSSPSSPGASKPARTLRATDGHGGTPSFQTTRGAPSKPAPTPGAPSSPQTGASSGAAASAGGGSASTPSVPQQPGRGSPSGPLGSIPPVAPPSVSPPTVSVPSVTTPAVSTPSVTTPSVTTPTVSTPSVTTPSVTVGGANLPSVTVPGVTVPSVTVPSVTVPSVTVPRIELPNVLDR